MPSILMLDPYRLYSAGGSFSPLDLSPALWIDPSDAATVTISGSSGAYIGANGLVLTGANSNYATVSNLTAHNVTGDIDLIAKIIATDWTPALTSYVFAKWSSGAGYGLQLGVAGVITLYYGLGGGLTVDSTAVNTFTDGTAGWIRATRASASGDVNFYTSTDGSSWTQLGTTVSTSAGALGTPSNGINVGSLVGGGANFVGTIARAIVKNGIAGTTVFDADFESATPFVSAFTESALGAPVYVVSSTATSSTASYGYVGPTGLVNGGSASYSTTTDSAALSITGDLDLLVRLKIPAYPSSGQWSFLDKFSNSAGQRSYGFGVGSNQQLLFEWSTNGTDTPFFYDAVGGAITAGTTMWLRATLDVDNGAAGHTVTFYTAADSASVPSSWTTVATRTGAGITSVFDGNLALLVGARASGVNPMTGTVLRAIVKNGIAGTTVFDADFAGAADYCTSFTESSSNAATVTITATNTPANAAGACVSQINDKSGNARHLTQGTLANMPKYWNGRNGLNVLVFDGASDSVSVTWAGLANNFFSTVFARVNDTGGSKVLIGLGNDLYPMWFTSAELLWGYITAGGVGSVAAANRVVGSTCITDMTAAAPRQWLDGVLASAASTSSATGGTFNLGQGGISNIWYSGECGEVVVNLSAPAAGDITSQQSYVKTKWGTP